MSYKNQDVRVFRKGTRIFHDELVYYHCRNLAGMFFREVGQCVFRSGFHIEEKTNRITISKKNMKRLVLYWLRQDTLNCSRYIFNISLTLEITKMNRLITISIDPLDQLIRLIIKSIERIIFEY